MSVPHYDSGGAPGCSRHLIGINPRLPLSHFGGMEIEAYHRRKYPQLPNGETGFLALSQTTWLQDLEDVEGQIPGSQHQRPCV